jgi:hypothetical protein
MWVQVLVVLSLIFDTLVQVLLVVLSLDEVDVDHLMLIKVDQMDQLIAEMMQE